jgi:hypothetical protein
MLGYESFEIPIDNTDVGLSSAFGRPTSRALVVLCRRLIPASYVMWAVQMRKKALRQYCLWESTRYNFDMGYLVEDMDT